MLIENTFSPQNSELNGDLRPRQSSFQLEKQGPSRVEGPLRLTATVSKAETKDSPAHNPDTLISGRDFNRITNAQNTLNSHVIERIVPYPKESNTDEIDPCTTLLIEDAANMSRAFEVADRMLPKEKVSELTALLRQQVKTACGTSWAFESHVQN